MNTESPCASGSASRGTIAGFVCLLGLLASAGAGPIQLGSTTVNHGDSFSIALTVDSGSQVLGRYDVNFSFDGNVLQVTGAVGGNGAFATTPSFNTPTPTNVIVSGENLTSLSSPTGVTVVARINFTAIGSSGASSPLTFNSASAVDVDTVDIPTTPVNGSVTINSPSTTTSTTTTVPTTTTTVSTTTTTVPTTTTTVPTTTTTVPTTTTTVPTTTTTVPTTTTTVPVTTTTVPPTTTTTVPVTTTTVPPTTTTTVPVTTTTVPPTTTTTVPVTTTTVPPTTTTTVPPTTTTTVVGVDATPPLLSVSIPKDNQTFTNAGIVVSGTATDASGINSVTVQGLPATLNGTNWSQPFTLVLGTNAITVVATDNSVNRNTTTRTVHAILIPPPPVAGFTGAPTTGLAPLDVTFTDASSGAITNYHWSFGDGSVSNMTVTTFVHTYLNPGTDTVTLTVSGPGGSSTTNRANYIVVPNYRPPVANFEPSVPVTDVPPKMVSFTNLSSGVITNNLWVFGDGTTDGTANPTHFYGTAGVFSVSLTVSGPGGSDLLLRPGLITLTNPPPVSGFTAWPTNGTAPLTVWFTNTSSGAISDRSWNFGDGFGSSEVNPSHTYSNAGVFSVSLTVSGPGGSDTSNKADLITVVQPCSLAEAVNQPTWTFTNVLWECQSDVTHDGTNAAMSGEVGDGQSSWFGTTTNGPGTLRFWWKVSSETNDWLRFEVDGQLVSHIAGEVDWEQKTLLLSNGVHQVNWVYTKNGSGTGGLDAGWVDEIQFLGGAPAAFDAAWSGVKQKCGPKGCTLNGKLSVQNTRVASLPPTTVSFYLSDDAAFDGGDVPLQTMTTKVLKLGKKWKGSLKHTLPAGQSASGKYLLAVVCNSADDCRVVAVFGPLP